MADADAAASPDTSHFGAAAPSPLVHISDADREGQNGRSKHGSLQRRLTQDALATHSSLTQQQQQQKQRSRSATARLQTRESPLPLQLTVSPSARTRPLSATTASEHRSQRALRGGFISRSIQKLFSRSRVSPFDSADTRSMSANSEASMVSTTSDESGHSHLTFSWSNVSTPGSPIARQRPHSSSSVGHSLLGPLHLAAAAGDLASLKNLLTRPDLVAVDIPDSEGVTPFMVAILSKQQKGAEFLLLQGADINCLDHRSRSILHWVVYNNQRSNLKWLLQHGANWRQPDEGGRTPLHWATDKDTTNCLRTLLDFVTVEDIDMTDTQGMTAVAWATYHNHAKHLKLLLKHKADPSIPNLQGRRCIHFAAQHMTPTCVDVLLSNAGGLSTVLLQDADGRTPLHLACMHGSLAVVRALLACLHQLARASQDPIEELARLLHQHDHTQRYALHFAAVMGRHAIVNELLTAGHSPHVVDNQQRLPLWYAESKGMADVCAILRTAMERQPLQSTSTAS
eukprot:m.80756 g.80756  ORF g.80756 m.80756 type:complete len:513 (-) comp12609_c1_seq4:252-1790(-)